MYIPNGNGLHKCGQIVPLVLLGKRYLKTEELYKIDYLMLVVFPHLSKPSQGCMMNNLVLFIPFAVGGQFGQKEPWHIVTYSGSARRELYNEHQHDRV